MQTALLTTKLYMPPARPGLVARPRLTARLTEGLQRPLTLISAPAGFGKTTVVSEWRDSPQGQDFALAWLSLDEQDNEPSRFWGYVVAALRTLPIVPPDLGAATLRVLESPAAVPPEQLLAPLINEVNALAARPFVLVLDDLHVVESPAVHGALTFLVEHLPQAMHLVLLTRADPPWPLARLRANRQLVELRAADLRFTPEEAALMLRQDTGLDFAPADLRALDRRTEGWAAALQMVALSLSLEECGDPHAFVQAFTGDNQYIADYLAEEVLARLPEELQRFLLDTCVLERFCAGLCEAVTGADGGVGPGSGNAGLTSGSGGAAAADLLARVERANLFLVPLDRERRWYRYHHLFADLLRARLHRTGIDYIAARHERAARWYEQNGFAMDAAAHAIAAGNHDLAAHLVEAHAHGWWALAQPSFVKLVTTLPAEVMRRRPRIRVFQAWMGIITGNLAQTASLLDGYLLEEADAPTAAFVSLMRQYLRLMNDQPYQLTEADVAATGSIPEDAVAMRNSADVVLAHLLYAGGELDRAAAVLRETAQREIARHSTNAIPIVVSWLTRIYVVQGRAKEAEQVTRRYQQVMTERGANRFFCHGNANAALAWALLMQGDLAQAESEALAGVAANEAWGLPGGVHLAYTAYARVLVARGKPQEALQALDRAGELTRGRGKTGEMVAGQAAIRVRAWLDLGDLAAATRWVAERGLSPSDELSFRRELEHITLSRVLLAQGRADEAAGLLARLAEAARAGGRAGHLADIRALMGQAPTPSAAHRTPQAGLIEPLSSRELDVLLLLAAGHSNQEIADRLIVAVGTVKTHVHNIYGKLGAVSRTQAIARAHELNLLP